MNRRSFIGYSTIATAGACLDGSVARLSAQIADASSGQAAPSIVQTTGGRVRGMVLNNVHTFKGVPYGATSAGAGRFLPPGKMQPWTGVRDTVALGPRAPQIFGGEPPEVAATDTRGVRGGLSLFECVDGESAAVSGGR